MCFMSKLRLRKGATIENVKELQNTCISELIISFITWVNVKKYGKLPYCDINTETGYLPNGQSEVEGEVAFTNIFVENGYDLVIYDTKFSNGEDFCTLIRDNKLMAPNSPYRQRNSYITE